MASLKCKMCGGDLRVIEGETVCECEYCGSRQTVPLMDDEKKAAIYERANRLRANADFDRAFSVYEGIAQAYPTDAEAFWGELLCKYGIEYVDDPATGKKIPTCHRSSYTSLLDDEAFAMVMENADPEARKIYREQAKQIEEIRKGIIQISSNEEPYDVFICYKETGEDGERTQDSVQAQEVYDELTEKGYRVFFSRITLEDKLGEEYEPYIFAALNSAKVMLVFGSDYEYFNAPWVKNEWSRFLDLMAKENKKYLIPCYKDIDAYDLPKEFQRLQALDMSKIGWIQDLVRGIGKIVRPSNAANTNASDNIRSSEIEPLLQRAYIFLEDGNFKDADDYCEKVLDKDPKNANAYLGKLMAEQYVKKPEDLKNCSKPFNNSNNYEKVLRYGDQKLADTLNGYIKFINDRNENSRKTGVYNAALKKMNNAASESDFKTAATSFQSIRGFKDSEQLIKKCLDQAETCRKNEIYHSAKKLMAGDQAKNYEEAIRLFSTISEWRDSEDQISACNEKIKVLKAQEETRRIEHERLERERKSAAEKAAAKKKRITIIAAMIILAVIVFAGVFVTVIQPKQKHNKAMRLLESGKYDEAFALLEELGENDLIASSKYDIAVSYMENGDYLNAYDYLYDISDYKDSGALMSSIAIFPTEIQVNEDGKTIVTMTFEYDDSGIMISSHRENPQSSNDYIMNSSGEIIERKDSGDDSNKTEELNTYNVNANGTVTLTELHTYDDGSKGKFTTEFDRYGVEINADLIEGPSGEDEYGHPIMPGVNTVYKKGILSSVENSHFDCIYEFTQNKGFLNVDESIKKTNWRNVGIVTYTMWYNELNKSK